MSYNIIEVLKEIAEKNGISNDNIVASVKNAISKTFSTLYPGQIIEVEMNENSLHVYQVLTVAEDDDNFDDYINITPEKAKGYSIGDTYKKEINLEKQPTDVVQSIMKNLRYGIVSSTNNNVYNKWIDKVGTILRCEVEEKKSDHYLIKLDDKGDMFGILPYAEQAKEKLIPGQKYSFYVKDVRKSADTWPVILSRSNVALVKHFLKINIPEIGSGIVEIKKIARVPGIKTKVAVVSNQPSVTIGSIIGNKGERINEISKNIGGERIDIIEYSDDLGRFVINACSPTHLVGYKISENGITVVVDESKVALLIGKRGADVKLLSILLGKPVSIISSTQANEEGLDYTPVDESVYYRPRNSKPTGSYETKKENTFSANFISDDEE